MTGSSASWARMPPARKAPLPSPARPSGLSPSSTSSKPQGRAEMAIEVKPTTPAKVTAEDLTKDEYKFGWHDELKAAFKSERGLSEEAVPQISAMKANPDWMPKFRLKAPPHFNSRPMPNWGADLGEIDFSNIFYYLKPQAEQGKTWDDIPTDIKNTFDRLGIPEAEQKFLGGVSAQYESEVVYHSIREDLEKQGVIFTDCDTGLREHSEIFRKYFGTIIPPNDNKFAALNSAVWSGGSFDQTALLSAANLLSL